MERRVSVIAGVALVLLAVVAVQLADPRLQAREPPEVDFSEPPAEVAADSARQFEYVDYAYRIEIRNDPDEKWEQLRKLEVDNSQRRYYKEGLLGESGILIYGTKDVTYVRPGPDEAWRVTGDPEVKYPARVITQPFLHDRIEGSVARITNQNESSVTIQLRVHPLKIAPRFPGNSTFVVSKESGLIEEASISYITPTGPRYLRFTLLHSGRELNEPGDIPPSPKAIIWDILRGPVLDL